MSEHRAARGARIRSALTVVGGHLALASGSYVTVHPDDLEVARLWATPCRALFDRITVLPDSA